MTPPDSVGKVVAEMLQGGGTETGWIGIDTARAWAARLQALDRQRQEEAAELAADRDSWRDQASDRLEEWDAMRQRAEAAEEALAEARELLIDVMGWIPNGGAWHTDEPMKAMERARAFLTRTAKE